MELVLQACKIKFNIRDGTETDTMRLVVGGSICRALNGLRLTKYLSPYPAVDEETIEYYLFIKDQMDSIKPVETKTEVVS